jgi:NADH:ubiquinone oxidoreductase subunit 5 (subunit L)/multisubunit Na+/H+ antiporter MnhA subunit
MLNQIAWLVPLLPLLAAACIGIGFVLGVNRGESGERQTYLLAVGAIAASFVLMLALDIHAMIDGIPGYLLYGEWFHSGEFTFSISLLLDGLGLVFGTLFALLLLIAIRFSVNYMHREAGFQRFFMILSLFASAMLLIVQAGSGTLTFVGWELAGVSSYLLIGYAIDRNTATQNANYAFITNRIGDAGFILGLFVSLSLFGTTEWTLLSSLESDQQTLLRGMLIAGFLVAALAKSAQLPFAAWISKALEGPTPSSAIFYGSLMVHAGVFLVIRLQPLIEQTPVMMWVLVFIGGLTALYGWLAGLVQTDVKSSLMFSTTSQVGLMFVSCGLGWFEFAAWYLALHAIWRAYQFLASPGLMHMVTRAARPVPSWLARQQSLYTVALQRLWLEQLAEWLLIRPVDALSRELVDFDDKVVNRIAGLPNEQSSLTRGGESQWVTNIGRGRGFAGRTMEKTANAMHWFEEHLILKGSGDGLLGVIQHLGLYMQRVEQLLAQPRYLVLMILATFAVII